MIKRDMIDDIFDSLPYTYKGTTCNNIGQLIAVLNSRQPKDFNGDNEDPRGNANKTKNRFKIMPIYYIDWKMKTVMSHQILKRVAIMIYGLVLSMSILMVVLNLRLQQTIKKRSLQSYT